VVSQAYDENLVIVVTHLFPEEMFGVIQILVGAILQPLALHNLHLRWLEPRRHQQRGPAQVFLQPGLEFGKQVANLEDDPLLGTKQFPVRNQREFGGCQRLVL